MAAAVHKLLHPHSHSHAPHPESKTSADSHAEPTHTEHQQTSTEDAGDQEKREDEKHQLMQWEEQKQPLSPNEVHQDPEKKVVGHSSRVLRQEDFELIKTLGTGARP